MSSSQFSPVFSPQNDSRNSGLNEYELDLVSRGRSRSTIMREKWLRDFNNGIRQGEGDWKGDRNMDEIEIPDNLQKLDLKDECILILPDKNKGKIAYRLPILQPTLGEASIDIRQLHPKLNITTYDPGYMSTASCHSAITYIDGNQGILSHRGYRIEDLFEHSDYVELCFLLLYGELPSKNDKIEHENQIKQHMLVHEKLIQFYKGFRYDAHPMAIMCAVVGGLSSFYHEELDIQNPDHRLLCAYRLIAKMPTLAAIAYKTSKDQPVVYPKKKYSYAENFLYMMFSTPVEEYVVNPMMAKALDAFLMLHADHEQNASTSTVRIAGSSHANPFACVACGITALWGPQHGGANEAVLKMLEEIGSKDRIPEYIKKAKDKKDPFRLMGFGHRVYKNYDPRAKIMQKICHDLLTALNKKNEPLLELALELERIALSDDYFKSRKLYPNVDFYSGIVLKALNIPETMFTVLFAVARTVGWVAHWKEMIEDPKQRIGRPRQLYVGKDLRKFIPIDQRTHIGIESGWV